MRIQGFGQYYDFQSNYRIHDIPTVNPADAVESNQQQQSISQNQSPQVQIEEISDNRPRSVDPNEVSIGFNKTDDFSYLGKDKDIEVMDMQKAISDMQQDSILQEYQYFIGNAKNIFQSEDGVVLQKF